jgi:Zn-dependent M28 family amino/carboxypeptidase
MNVPRLLIAAVLLGGCASAPARQPAEPTGAAALARAAETIQPRDFYGRIGFFASDELRGRDTPSPGLDAAAAYMASEFYRFGLDPAGIGGTFTQRWPYTTRAMDVAGARFRIDMGGTARTLVHGADYAAQPGIRGTFTGGLVFVGGDVPAADIRGESLRGRAAVLYPRSAATPQVLARARASADSAGAGAVVIVLPAESDERAVAAMAGSTRGMGNLPVFFLRQDRARELFRESGLDFDQLTRADAPRRVVPLPGATASLGASVAETVHQVPNVVGLLRGSDPELRDTYIVISAHIDHVGSGCRGTSPQDNICNGADDDASGSAAVIELAEAFASLPVAPRRSIVFLGVSGEEKGLLGSRHYADNPTVPRGRIVANINLDMIGRSPHPDTVAALGQTYSSLGPLAQRVNAALPELRLTIADDMWPGQNLFFRSDHFNFMRHEIPALFFFTGLHDDYHAASDTVDKIDLDQITRITRLVFHLVVAIAEDTEPPAWDPAGLEEVRRLTSQRR